MYTLTSQRLLHQWTTMLYLCFIVKALADALAGHASWRQLRVLMLVFPSNRFLPLVGLHLLEGGTVLRRPTHECYYTVCRASDTVAEAWMLAGMEMVGVWLIAMLCSPENRQLVARCSGLTHVRLRLGEITGIAPAAWAENAERRQLPTGRRVSWGAE